MFSGKPTSSNPPSAEAAMPIGAGKGPRCAHDHAARGARPATRTPGYVVGGAVARQGVLQRKRLLGAAPSWLVATWSMLLGLVGLWHVRASDQRGSQITDNLGLVVIGIVAIVAIGGLISGLDKTVFNWVTTQLGLGAGASS